MTIKISHIVLLFFTILAGAQAALAGEATKPSDAFRATVFPLPRFVSLSSDEVFVRSGPGSRYPVKWVYHRKGLPVEVILEYEVWRKVRDVDGEAGWVHQSLISGKRTAMIREGGKTPLLQKPKESAYKTALLEPRVVVNLEECHTGYCRVSADGYRGWVERGRIWGVYEKETVE